MGGCQRFSGRRKKNFHLAEKRDIGLHGKIVSLRSRKPGLRRPSRDFLIGFIKIGEIVSETTKLRCVGNGGRKNNAVPSRIEAEKKKQWALHSARD